MKIDRFVRVMLVLIAALLALNCAKDLNQSFNANGSDASVFESSVEAALPPSFLQVGKSYEGNFGSGNINFKVLEGQNTGWVKVQIGGQYGLDSGNIVLLNPNAFLYIKAIE